MVDCNKLTAEKKTHKQSVETRYNDLKQIDAVIADNLCKPFKSLSVSLYFPAISTQTNTNVSSHSLDM